MATADRLLKLMFSWIEQRESCAEQLKKMARELESHRQNCNASECVGSTVSVVGSLSLLGAGVATLFTGGAAAPLLAVAGAAYSGTGLAISLGTKITEYFINSSTMKEAQNIAERSNEIQEEIKECFERLKKEIKKANPYADPDEVNGYVVAEFLAAMARRSGLKKIELSQYISTAGLVTNILSIFSFFQLAIKFLGEATIEQLAEKFGKGCIEKVALQLGKQVASHLGKQQGKKCTTHLTKKFGQEFGEEIGKKLGEELGKKLGEQYSKQLYTTGVQTALKGGAKVVGGIIGLAFDLPEAIGNWKDMIKNNHVTEASKSLRDTADAFQDSCRKLRKLLKIE